MPVDMLDMPWLGLAFLGKAMDLGREVSAEKIWAKDMT